MSYEIAKIPSKRAEDLKVMALAILGGVMLSKVSDMKRWYLCLMTGGAVLCYLFAINSEEKTK